MREKKGHWAKLGKWQRGELSLPMLHDYRQSQSAYR